MKYIVTRPSAWGSCHKKKKFPAAPGKSLEYPFRTESILLSAPCLQPLGTLHPSFRTSWPPPSSLWRHSPQHRAALALKSQVLRTSAGKQPSALKGGNWRVKIPAPASLGGITPAGSSQRLICLWLGNSNNTQPLTQQAGGGTILHF